MGSNLSFGIEQPTAKFQFYHNIKFNLNIFCHGLQSLSVFTFVLVHALGRMGQPGDRDYKAWQGPIPRTM